jgi:integrase
MDTPAGQTDAPKKKRREPERRNFDTPGILNNCLKTWGAEFWDQSTPGFGLRVSPKGKRVWMWKFRGRDGKEVTDSLPYHSMPPKDANPADFPVPTGKFTLETAREAYAEVRRRARLSPEQIESEDSLRITLVQAVPQYLDNKRKRKTREPLDEVTKAAYLKQWVWLAPLAGHFVLSETKAGTWTDLFEREALNATIKRTILEQDAGWLALNPAQRVAVKKRLERGLSANWETEEWWAALSDEERRGVRGRLASVTPEDFAGKILKSSPVMQAANLVQGIYSYYEGREVVTSNPIKRVKLHWRVSAPDARKIAIPTLNLPGFWTALQQRKYKTSRQAIEVMLLAGFRNSAARMMRWEQLDMQNGVYLVRPGDTGWKGFFGPMPLCEYLTEMLRERYASRADNEWVFPRRSGKKYPYLSRLNDSINLCCEGLGARYKAHDLRRGFSRAAKIVTRSDYVQVGALLGHKWALDAGDKTMTNEGITLSYMTDEFRSLQFATNNISAFMLQVCGAMPMSDDNRTLLEEQGIDTSTFHGDGELPEDDEVVTESD